MLAPRFLPGGESGVTMFKKPDAISAAVPTPGPRAGPRRARARDAQLVAATLHEDKTVAGDHDVPDSVLDSLANLARIPNRNRTLFKMHALKACSVWLGA